MAMVWSNNKVTTPTLNSYLFISWYINVFGSFSATYFAKGVNDDTNMPAAASSTKVSWTSRLKAGAEGEDEETLAASTDMVVERVFFQ